MKRKCQINAVQPITCFQVPIIGNTELELTTDEIYKCLCCKAEIIEILPNGQMVGLDFSNYDKKIEIIDNDTKKVVTNIQEENVEDNKQVEDLVEDTKEITEETAQSEENEIVEEPVTDVKESDKEQLVSDTVRTQVYSKNNRNYQSKNKKRYNNKK